MDFAFTVKKLNKKQTYSRSEVVSLLQEQNENLKENSCVWMIGDLINQGVLRHSGFNQYTLASEYDKPNYKPIYLESTEKIKEEIIKKYPRISFTVFETNLLNEFLNHQIVKNTMFFQVEKDVSAYVFEALKEKNYPVMYRPTLKEFRLYWKADSIVILDRISEAPIDAEHPFSITIEKMLVDIYCDKTITMTYSEAEYPTIIDTAFNRYNVDSVRLLRYARRRNKKGEIKAIIEKRKQNADKR